MQPSTAAQCTAHARAPAQETRDVAVQGRERLRVRGVARGRAGLPARAACERSAQTRCPACLGAQRAPKLQTFLLLLVSAVCPKHEELHQQMCISSGDLRALRCSRCSASAHLHLLLDPGQQRRRVLQPAGRLLVVVLGPAPHAGARAGRLAGCGPARALAESVRVYLGPVPRLDERAVHRAGQALGLSAEVLLHVLELHQREPLNAAATKQTTILHKECLLAKQARLICYGHEY